MDIFEYFKIKINFVFLFSTVKNISFISYRFLLFGYIN